MTFERLLFFDLIVNTMMVASYLNASLNDLRLIFSARISLWKENHHLVVSDFLRQFAH